ncbi:hypothetical protein GCM10010486_06180 [Nonomuraea roseoviolacea subsp. carminata]
MPSAICQTCTPASRPVMEAMLSSSIFATIRTFSRARRQAGPSNIRDRPPVSGASARVRSSTKASRTRHSAMYFCV